ncbi:DUF58 domain-containing protein [Halomicroarcula sp. GCM10025324]|uniref:DUF58 domain-containing protein n=1 Tax=Haloarcula TaxID=2237 RepID=UPI0023E8C6CC|nr:DUF58 domain-containing protein [Halomicroarcula sp. ZS-22-S1]
MRPTRRGVGVLVVALAAVAMGARYGQAGLNAVAGPLLVALLAAAVQVRLAGTPTVERDPPRRGFPDDRRQVELTVEGSGIATLTDRLPEGVAGTASARRSLPTTVTYDLTYERRGEHRLGPVDVVLTDVLGLVRRSATVEAVDDVLVYPPVYRMGGPDAFARTLAPEPEDRQAFDRLREYVPGDSLRDVHWKSSAKRDELTRQGVRRPPERRRGPRRRRGDAGHRRRDGGGRRDGGDGGPRQRHRRRTGRPRRDRPPLDSATPTGPDSSRCSP